MGELTGLTLAEARDRLAKGEISAVELTDAHLAAIEQARDLNAFITETPDKAREMAKASDERRARGEAGPLEGIPLAIKDLFCTEGIQTTAGSHILEGFTPTYESTVSANLWRDGAVLLGKTNLDEFAMGSSNTTSYYGNVVNPWQRAGDSETRLVPGRLLRRVRHRRGGAAGAGRDRHRYRRLDPPAGQLLRHHRHEADLWPLLALGHRGLRLVPGPGGADDPHGARRGDPAAFDGRLRPEGFHQRRHGGPDFEAALSGDIRGLKVGIPAEYRVDGMPAEIDALWQQGIDWLKEAGAEPVEISLPHTKYALPTYYIVAPAEASSNLARYDGVRYGLRVPGNSLIEMYENTRAEGFGTEVKRRLMIGTYVLSAGYYDAYYLKAQKLRTLIARDFEQAYERCDVVLTPTTPSTAFAIGEKQDDPIAMYLNDVFTVPASLAGLPGISVPAGLGADGLPLGLQLIARPFDEETLFRVADVLEAAAGFDAKPALMAG